MNTGWLAIIPPLIAIVLAIVTKEVLLSLFIACFAGATILAGNPLEGFVLMLNKYLVGSLTDKWNVSILIFCLTIGGLIGIIDKNGGTKGLASLLIKRAVSKKSALLTTWVLGIVIFFDDYANSLIVGNSMKPITDRMGISREKLAYVVDSTAAPVSSIALISTWVGMELGLIRTGLDTIHWKVGAYDVFLKTIPYRFYSLLTLAFVLMIIFSGRDFSLMRKAEMKALKEQALKKEVEEMEIGNRWYNALIPFGVILLVTVIGLFQNGGGFKGVGLREAFSNADSSVVLLWASFIGVIVAWFMSFFGKTLKVSEISEAFVEGVKSMMVPVMILSLAWTLGSLNTKLGTANFMVQQIGSHFPTFLIPLIMFLVPAFVAFSTGTSWGTNAIVMPIAINLAFLSGGTALVIPTIGAVLTGAVMGDHISPVSDTTIMSSMASGCDHISHVNTQIPYALVVAGVAVVFGFIPAGLGINPLISLVLGGIVLFSILRFFGKKAEECTLEEIISNRIEDTVETDRI